MRDNTLFLRLEGPMQAWGSHESKFVIRRTKEAPTKSGVIGMLCAAMGLSRLEAQDGWLERLSELEMGVRIDRPGIRWWDWHTVGAGMKMATAEGGKKDGPMLTRREYLCDASFLVALRDGEDLIDTLSSALENPVWALFLGRKNCPMSRPVNEHGTSRFGSLEEALASIPWPRRHETFIQKPDHLDLILDWRPTEDQPEAPGRAEVWYDVPFTFDPPSHRPRFVVRSSMIVGENGDVKRSNVIQGVKGAYSSERPRANYQNTEFRKKRAERLEQDQGRCTFCGSPASTVQHITYRRAGGNESPDDLKSLCRLCHDAITMLEYGANMGIDRIDPTDEKWRERILEKRAEIVKFRSKKTRDRRFKEKEGDDVPVTTTD